MFGYSSTPEGPVAYPTDPSQVGLTVAKSTLTVYTTHQTITVDTDISNSAFTRGLTVDGCEAYGENVWLYNVTGGGGGGNAFRLLNGADLVLRYVQVGYDGTAVGLDPIGGTWDPADYVTPTASSSGGVINIRDFHIAYVREGPNIGQYFSRWERGWIGPFFSADPADHVDVFQTRNASSGFLIRHVRAQPEMAPGSEPASNRFFQIEDTLGPVSGTLDGNFISWVGVAAMNAVPTTNGIEIALIGNTFDSDVGDPTPIPNDSAASFSPRYENRWSADGELIPGDQESSAMTAVHVASGQSATSTVTLPSGAAEGDLIVVDVFLEDSQASAGTTDITPPAADDWNLVGNTDGANATSDLASFWRFVKAGDTPGSTTFTFTPAGNYAAIISVYTDTDGTTPIGDVQATSGASGTSITLAGITTTQANQLVRTTVATRGGATGFTATSPGSQNERGDEGSGRRIASYDFTVASAGASGSAQYSMSDATNTIQGIMYAIVGAASGTDQTAAATLAGTGSLTAAATVTRKAAANLAGAGALTAAAQRKALAAANLAGAGALTASAQREALAAAALSGTGTLTASGQRTTFIAAALQGVGSLVATAAGGTTIFRRTARATAATVRTAKATATRRSHKIQ